jgi:hypothetical protein
MGTSAKTAVCTKATSLDVNEYGIRKRCIAMPAAILPPVTRHNQLWNIQLLAISLPLMAVLPKAKHVMLCCSEAPDWALPQHRPKKRKCVLPPHTEACALNLCALHPLRAKHLSGTHAVLLGRELPTCLELFSAFWGTDRGWSRHFFWTYRELCSKQE